MCFPTPSGTIRMMKPVMQKSSDNRGSSHERDSIGRRSRGRKERTSETRCSFEAVTVSEEDAVRMVVSGGSEHALTVLWMGRWFSASLISVSPLQETVPVGGTSGTEGEFFSGTRGSVHRESSSKLHPPTCDPSCTLSKCVLACSTPAADRKDSKEANETMWTVLIAGFCAVSVHL